MILCARRHFRRRLVTAVVVLGFFGVTLLRNQKLQTPEKQERGIQDTFLELRRRVAEARARRGGVQRGYFVGLNNTNNDKIINQNGHKPIILLWNRDKSNYAANPDVCGGGIDCEITSNRLLFNLSDAVVFADPFHLSIIPEQRKQKQLFVWWQEEKNHRASLGGFEYIFNLTFNYRQNAGIYAPYGSLTLILEELRRANEVDLEVLLKKKRKSGKIAAWAVSNCKVHDRMQLAKDIMKAGLPVDTFGKCFNRRRIGKGKYDESFYDALSEYKFYFAFENGYHCKDYITEKFWFNGLRSGAVPIVWGAKKSDIVAVAPEHSFIHVDDFNNTADLVAYLNYLSSDEAAYRRHLEWRTWVSKPHLIEKRLRPENRDNDLRSFCKLCRILQEENHAESLGKERRKMLVPSLREFWWGDEDMKCLKY